MDKILYLVHSTTKNPSSYKELRISTDIDNQFPGVYLTLITKDNINVEGLYGGKYYMIFSKKLLEQKNYHINIRDYNGIISEKNTYFPWNLKEAVEKIKEYSNDENAKKSNEIVFHDNIPFTFLCKIIERPNMSDLEGFLNFKLPKEECITTAKPNLTLLPFYVYSFENTYDGVDPLPESSLEFYKKMARLARLDPISGSIKEIIEELEKKKEYFWKHRNEQNITSLINSKGGTLKKSKGTFKNSKGTFKKSKRTLKVKR
jgi:hypothetical protein